MLQLSCKFNESAENLCWIIMLTNLTDIDYVVNAQEDEK